MIRAVATPPSPRERRLAYLAWTAVCIIWGTTYLGIRITLETMPPALMASLRWLIASALLIGYMRARGEPLPPSSRWGGIALMGFLLLFVGNGGVAYAEQWVPSGLAAVLVATAPFWMAGVGESCRGQWRKPAGAHAPGAARRLLGNRGAGLAGAVDVIFRQPALPPRRAAAADGVAGMVDRLCVLAAVRTRRRIRARILGTTALQMLAGGIFLGALGLARGELAHFAFNTRTTIALVCISRPWAPSAASSPTPTR